MKAPFIKLILNNNYYTKIKNKLIDALFEGEELLIWKTIQWAHNEFKRDLNVDELYDLVKVQNPVLTLASKTNVSSIIDDIKDATDIKEDAASVIISYMWKRQVGLDIANYGIELSEGKRNDLFELKSTIEKVAEDFTPNDVLNVIPTDVDDVLAALADRTTWKFNLPSLYAKVPGMSGGDFLYILARPESGKTAWIVNMVAGPGGFAEQGAKVHCIFNEEPAIRTMIRAISSCTGMTREEIEADKQKASELFNKISSKLV